MMNWQAYTDFILTLDLPGCRLYHFGRYKKRVDTAVLDVGLTETVLQKLFEKSCRVDFRLSTGGYSYCSCLPVIYAAMLTQRPLTVHMTFPFLFELMKSNYNWSAMTDSMI